MSNKKSTRGLEELLESDDELPDSYEELPDLPAYKDDKRFNTLQYQSLEKNELPALCKTKQNVSSPEGSNKVHDSKNIFNQKSEKKLQRYEQPKKYQHSEKTLLVKRGVLSKPDLLCLKALVSISTDVNVMWFVNFLMRKDMQDKYKFLKSCLIEDLENTSPFTKKNLKSEVKFKYELNIVKK